QGSLLFVAVEVDAEAAANRSLVVAGQEVSPVRRVGKANSRTKVPVLDRAAGVVAVRIAWVVHALGRRGEYLGLLPENEAIEGLPAVLGVVVRSVDLVARSNGECEVVLDLPLVLGVPVVLVSAGVDDRAGTLGIAIRNAKQEVHTRGAGRERSVGGIAEHAIDREVERIVNLETARIEPELERVPAHDLGEVVRQLIVRVFAGLRSIVAETKGEQARHRDQRQVRRGGGLDLGFGESGG